MEKPELISMKYSTEQTLRRCALALLLVAGGCLALMVAMPAQADEAKTEEKVAIEPNAIDALKAMSEYLHTLKTYQILASVTDEDVFEDGQKAQYGRTSNFLVNLPNQLRIDTVGDTGSRLYLYDGKDFTLYARLVDFYATVPAPPTLGELAIALEEKYGLSIPLMDFYHWSDPDWDPSAITAAVDVGPAVINGITTQQYAFRQEGIDWQIWIQKGDFPLPLKLVITSTTDDARPQHTAVYNWNLAPSFSEAAFTMDPDTTAQQVVLEDMNSKSE